MSADLLITNARIFDGSRLLDLGWISKTGDTWKVGSESPGDAIEVIDGEGGFVTTPLVDTHVHGGGGFSAEKGVDDMRGVIDFHAAHGVGRTALSLMTDSLEALEDQILCAHEITDSRFSGLHLEGPYLSPDFRGCHPPSLLARPKTRDLQHLIDIARGIVKSMTIAPELFSAEQLTLLTRSGIQLCLGHTSADYALCHDFFTHYGTVMTHAFNAMPGIHHRNPGPVPAALDTDAYTELIADGHHVDPAAARLLNPEKVILVTDAMSATGQPDGDYRVGATPVTVRERVARDQTGSLAGSTLLLHHAVTNYAAWIHSPELALRAAVTNPAKAYGDEPPTLSGTVLLWDQDLSLRRVLDMSPGHPREPTAPPN